MFYNIFFRIACNWTFHKIKQEAKLRKSVTIYAQNSISSLTNIIIKQIIAKYQDQL